MTRSRFRAALVSVLATRREYRLFLAAQTSTLLGFWAFSVSLPLLVLSLGGGPTQLGIVSALQFLPIAIVTPFGGTAIDRFHKGKLAFYVKVGMFLEVLAFAVVILLGSIDVFLVDMFAVGYGILNAFDMPLREALPADLVASSELNSAAAANWVSYNGARMLGAGMAGAAISLGGIAAGFAASAAVQGLAALLLLPMRDLPMASASRPPAHLGSNRRSRLLAGVAFARHDSLTLWMLTFLAGISLFSLNFQVLLPLLVQDVLHLQPADYGWYFAVFGLGTVGGASLTLARARSGSWRHVVVAGALLGSFEVLLAATGTTTLVLLLVAACGVCSASVTTMIAVIVQAHIPNQVRARVMALYLAIFFGTTPLGAIFAGTIAETSGVLVAFAACGSLALALSACAGVVFWRSGIRPATDEE